MHRSMREVMTFWKQAGLSMTQIATLMRLHHGGPCGVSEISGHLGITSAAASQMIERLVQMDLLERAENPSDRRAKQLTLTRKGQALIAKGVAARRRWMADLIRALSSEQQQTIGTALTYLTEAARRSKAPAEAGG